MNRVSKFITFFIISTLVVSIFNYTFASATVPSALTLSHLLNQIAQTPSPATTPTSNPSESNLTQNIIVAIVSAILGFIANLIIESYKKKNEAKFQISYQKLVKKGVVEIEKDIESQVSVLYNNRQTQNLYYFLFDIENTGNRTIKNQEIRFEFSNGSEIIDMFYEPSKPEMEMNVERINEPNLSNLEVKHRIGYFEPGKQFGFRFIVANLNNNEITLKHFTKNSTQDVNFGESSTIKTASSIDIIKDFFLWIIILIVVPVSIENILDITLFDTLASTIAEIIRLSTLALILQKLEAFITSVIDIIYNLQSKKGMNIDFNGEVENFIIQGDDSQTNIKRGV